MRYIIYLDNKVIGQANTHKEISDFLCCSRQHISNELKKNGGNIKSYGKEYTIIDKVKLFNTLHPNYLK